MEKLSIEAKAKTYDEAIKRLEDIKTGKCQKTFLFTEGLFDYIFPELAESEDERIRKAIIAAIKEDWPGHTDWIDWLEKQGEQKLIDKIQLGKKYKCIASPRYSTFMVGEIYKPEDKFLCSLMNFCSDCFEPIEDEQKPADKVKHKFNVGDIIKSTSHPMLRPRKIISIDKDCYWCEDKGCIGFAWEDDWELVEQKPSWNKEDEEKMMSIFLGIETFCPSIIYGNGKEELLNWFKDLKERLQPQNPWKPSDEQMITLRQVISGCSYDIEPLVEMEEQLKKLREE